MEIMVTQKAGEKYNNELIKCAAKFFADKLFKKKNIKKIGRIKISLVKAFESAGECYEYQTEDGLFLFEIKIDRETDFPNLISTLAHEMIHVGQIASGNLKLTDNGWYWCGKYFGNDAYGSLTEEQQCKTLPWERDAYHNEAPLSLKFFEYYYTNLY